jgi:hypothetical protein
MTEMDQLKIELSHKFDELTCVIKFGPIAVGRSFKNTGVQKIQRVYGGRKTGKSVPIKMSSVLSRM